MDAATDSFRTPDWEADRQQFFAFTGFQPVDAVRQYPAAQGTATGCVERDRKCTEVFRMDLHSVKTCIPEQRLRYGLFRDNSIISEVLMFHDPPAAEMDGLCIKAQAVHFLP